MSGARTELANRSSLNASARRGFPWTDLVACVAIFFAALGAYAHARAGDFVYDDHYQILNNPLVQRADLVGEALTSDVWAFRSRSYPIGDDAGAAAARAAAISAPATSAYYRPAFVLHLIWQHRLFGLENPKAWHVINVLLHGVVSVLAYLVVRRVGRLPAGLSFAAGLIFAVHPVHVESVTWISGSPDLLVGLGLFPCMVLAWVLAKGEGSSRPAWLSGVLWFAYVVGAVVCVTSKEIGVAIAPISMIIAWEARRHARQSSGSTVTPWLSPAVLGVVFVPVVITVAFLAVRAGIVGDRREHEVGVSTAALLYTQPSVGAFYLRQMLWPFENLWPGTVSIEAANAGFTQAGPGGVGPMHNVRPLNTLDLSTGQMWRYFLLPLLICVGAGAVTLVIAWRNAAARIGLVLLVCTLAPALYIVNMPPDHLVRDRYLYIPLLGMCMVIAGGLVELDAWLSRRRAANRDASSPTSSRLIFACTLVATLACIPLAVKTDRAGRDWLTNESLWAASLRHDPASVSSLQESARLLVTGKNATNRESLLKGVELYTRAIKVRAITASLSGRASAYLKLADLELGQTPRDLTSARLHAELAERDARSALITLEILTPQGTFPPSPDAVAGAGDEISLQTLDHLAMATERLARTRAGAGEGAADADVAKILEFSREVHPFARARVTAKLAVVYYLQNQKVRARQELEGALAAARLEHYPQSKLVIHRLAMILAEGPPPNPPDAARALDLLREFMSATNTPEGLAEPDVVSARADAQRVLDRAAQLPRPGAGKP